MNLARNYARVLTGFGPKRVDEVIALMRVKGHLTLLPQVFRVILREREEGEVLTVARENDVGKFSKQFPRARVVVDPSIVGGFVRRDGSRLTDASARRALVALYKNALTE